MKKLSATKKTAKGRKLKRLFDFLKFYINSLSGYFLNKFRHFNPGNEINMLLLLVKHDLQCFLSILVLMSK